MAGIVRSGRLGDSRWVTPLAIRTHCASSGANHRDSAANSRLDVDFTAKQLTIRALANDHGGDRPNASRRFIRRECALVARGIARGRRHWVGSPAPGQERRTPREQTTTKASGQGQTPATRAEHRESGFFLVRPNRFDGEPSCRCSSMGEI